jgi:hypothetical protein
MTTEDATKAHESAEKGKKGEGSRTFSDMCHQMMAGEMPPCCKTQMKDMMAQWMARLQASEGK